MSPPSTSPVTNLSNDFLHTMKSIKIALAQEKSLGCCMRAVCTVILKTQWGGEEFMWISLVIRLQTADTQKHADSYQINR